MDGTAANFAPNANFDYGCIYEGCTDSAAPNFDPTCNTEDGSCLPIITGCTDSRFLNYHAYYNVDDGSCSRGGCLVDTDPNYDLLATWNDGACSDRRRRLDSYAGCMDPGASTYDEAATYAATI